MQTNSPCQRVHFVLGKILSRGPTLGCGWYTCCPSMEGNWISFLITIYQLQIASWIRVGVCAHFRFWDGILSVLNFSCSHSLCEFTCTSALLCLENTVSLGLSPLLALAIFLPPLPPWPLSLRARGLDLHSPFRAEHSIASHLLSNPDQLWVCVLITMCCKRKLLSWRVRDALMWDPEGRYKTPSL